ncbi:hypothetical protein OG762_03720 [Streptomyces sp. NBC_01136]|uniref:hypothetical protein n=1 Tax=unclassified Streptomyces TaxID=2593676 RepID=UPI003247E025|nr:hypothetical protein OG762_03720 [Streptomyces sp. NBC_01136]
MSTNPFADHHVIYAVVLISLAVVGAGATRCPGRAWARLPSSAATAGCSEARMLVGPGHLRLSAGVPRSLVRSSAVRSGLDPTRPNGPAQQGRVARPRCA